ncbi:hypothetical protein SNEBB_006225 [Seison nebaliae]|nr:hypothetical protein SNEBB_006225 [Seison nebaliae]
MLRMTTDFKSRKRERNYLIWSIVFIGFGQKIFSNFQRMSSNDKSNENCLRLIIKCSQCTYRDMTVDCPEDMTVLQLKETLLKDHCATPKVEHQKLIFAGKIMEDGQKLKTVFKMIEGKNLPQYVVHLLLSQKHIDEQNKMEKKIKKEVKSSSSSSSSSGNIIKLENGKKEKIIKKSEKKEEEQIKEKHPKEPILLQLYDTLEHPIKKIEKELKEEMIHTQLSDREKYLLELYGKNYVDSYNFNCHRLYLDAYHRNQLERIVQNVHTIFGVIPSPDNNGTETQVNEVRPNVRNQPVEAPQPAPEVPAQQEAPLLPQPAPRVENANNNEGNWMMGGLAPRNQADEENENNDWLAWINMGIKFSIFGFLLFFYANPVRITIVLAIVILMKLYNTGYIFNNLRVYRRQQQQQQPAAQDNDQQDQPDIPPNNNVDENELRRRNVNGTENNNINEEEREEVAQANDIPNGNVAPQGIEMYFFRVFRFLGIFIYNFFVSLLPERVAAMRNLDGN